MSNKLDTAILTFLKPVFDQYPTCQKLGFNIYNFNDDSVHTCEESIHINDKSWDMLPDEKMSSIEDDIRAAIGKLPKIPELEEIRKQLVTLADAFYEKSCANSLNDIWRKFWEPDNLESFTDSISTMFKKRFPPRYVGYVSVEVYRDGTINYYPDGEEE